MKKKRWSFVVLTLLMVLVLSISIDRPIKAEELDDIFVMNTDIHEGDSEWQSRSNKAMEALQNLWSFIEIQYMENPQETTESGYMVSGLPSVAFPDWYGGNYLNQYGNLVVEIAGDLKDEELEKTKAKITEIAKCDELVFRPVKYSFSHLIEIMTEMNEYIGNEEYRSRRMFDQFVVGFGISESDNCVYVEIKDGDEEEIKKIQEFTNYKEEIRFKNVTGYAVDSANNNQAIGEASKKGCAILK